jgi:hypothetical protein
LKVVIFGLGYVGCTAAGCIASQGHQVIGIDVSQTKVDAINAGRSPIHEPGLGELIAEARAAGLIEARLAIGDALEGADIAIVCVGTPSGVDGAHNMGFIAQVTRDIAASVDPKRAGPLTVAYRSTMRPGTTEQLIRPIFRTALGEAADQVIELVYNPEFLREASAIADYFAPPKIVIGTLDGRASTAMDRLHEGIEAPTFHVGMREAEVTKFVDNTKPFRSFAQETTALLALTAGDSAAARDEAQRLVRRRPMPAEHLFALGLAEMRSGHPQAFAADFRAASTRGWRFSPLQVTAAQAALANGDVKGAANRVAALWAADSGNALLSGLTKSLLTAPGGAEAFAVPLAQTHVWSENFLGALPGLVEPPIALRTVLAARRAGARFNCLALTAFRQSLAARGLSTPAQELACTPAAG